jgi:hypothetical protein
MAFIPLAFAGGMAKRGSEILKEEREEALTNAEDTIKIFTELGLPKATERRSKRRQKDAMYDTLGKYFDGDQIAVIMKEGSGQAVLDHIASMEKKYENYSVNPNDIVVMDEGYEKHGYTKDQVLDLVMGRVDAGVPVLQAMEEVTGKKSGGSLTNLLGGNLGDVTTRRMSAVAEATGVSMNELAALAADNIVYDDIAVSGKTRLFDPAAAASASKDSFTESQAKTRLVSFGNSIGGGSMVSESEGVPIYKPETAEIGYLIDKKAGELLAEMREQKQGEPITREDMQVMRRKLEEWAVTTTTAAGKRIHKFREPPEEDGSSETTVGPQLNTEGLELGQLESLLREELKPGVDGTALDPKIAQSIVDQIAAAIKAEVKRTGGNMTAAQVDAEVARIAKQMGFDITPTLVAETKDDTIQSPGGDITVTN